LSPSALSGDYQFINALILPFAIVGFVIVAVGTYLRYDGRPGHETLGMVSQAGGWLATMLGSIVTTQIVAEDQLNCSLFGERCVTDFGGFLWETLLWPIVLDMIVLGVATLVGMLAARVTRRDRSDYHTLRSMVKEEMDLD
jgi:hypothetical protein